MVYLHKYYWVATSVKTSDCYIAVDKQAKSDASQKYICLAPKVY